MPDLKTLVTAFPAFLKMTLQKKKILFFINSLHFGGAERVVSQLIGHLNNDFEIHLALYHRIIEYTIPDDIQVLDLKENPAAGNTSIFLRLPVIAHKLNRYCKKESIQQVVTFLNRPCYISAFMRSLYGYKGNLIMCERSYQSNILNMIGGGSSFYKIISKKLIRFSYKRANLVLTNSFVSKNDLEVNFRITTPIKVIYNPVDIAAIEEKANERLHENLEKNTFYFISVGNFRVEKRFDMLIKAMAIIKKLPVKLILVGGGGMEAELKQLASKLQIADRVIFTGFEKNPFKYIKSANCFVLSSYTEGFPNVLLEALACKTPIIATDCKSGPRELLAPDTDPGKEIKDTLFEIARFGLLTIVNDAESLAAAMKKMYADKSLQDHYRSIAFARAKEFDVDIIKELFKEVFTASS